MMETSNIPALANIYLSFKLVIYLFSNSLDYWYQIQVKGLIERVKPILFWVVGFVFSFMIFINILNGLHNQNEYKRNEMIL